MHQYEQSSGTWTLPNGDVLHGYSGHGDGRNNPAMENNAGVGPCPRGLYTIGAPHVSEHTGPYTMNLEPVEHDACGRTLLRIHGDNVTHNASHGCIIIPGLINREKIWIGEDHKVTVI